MENRICQGLTRDKVVKDGVSNVWKVSFSYTQ